MNIRDEGQPILEGFNFYPLSSNSSFGFVRRKGENLYYVRYSKMTGKWVIGPLKPKP